MKKIIYVQLLGEGTLVYRPVPAIKIEEDIYRIKGEDIYSPAEEEWEFLPGTVVKVKQEELESEKVILAIEAIEE